MNILKASLYAMRLSFEMMKLKLPSWLSVNGISEYKISVIADGNKMPEIDVPDLKAVVKADSKFHSVMAASIIAKVERDKIMKEMDALYPEYGYAKHKGYPTKSHIEICRKIGPSPIQRNSFKY